jgi:hypothetical protein
MLNKSADAQARPQHLTDLLVYVEYQTPDNLTLKGVGLVNLTISQSRRQVYNVDVNFLPQLSSYIDETSLISDPRFNKYISITQTIVDYINTRTLIITMPNNGVLKLTFFSPTVRLRLSEISLYTESVSSVLEISVSTKNGAHYINIHAL